VGIADVLEDDSVNCWFTGGGTVGIAGVPGG
jgi:hypothetical protein